MYRKFKHILTFALLWVLFGSWGFVGHKSIVNKSIEALQSFDAGFAKWMELVAFHSADPDLRKPFDSTEFNKHFIDIDNYPEFIDSGKISMNFDTVVAELGDDFVHQQGILPWSTQQTIKNLTNAFAAKDFEKATKEAADLAHYIADGFMPLHISRNYDGQFSGNDGIHYRYESMMINKFIKEIDYTVEKATYIEDYESYIFDYLYGNHQLIDTLLWADKEARSINPDLTSDEYVENLWAETKSMTISQFQKASQSIANIIYSCWIDGGKPKIDEDFVKQKLSNSELKVEMVYFNGKLNSLNWIFRNNKNGKVSFEIKDTANVVIYEQSKRFAEGIFEEIESVSLEKGTYTFEVTSKEGKDSKMFKVY